MKRIGAFVGKFLPPHIGHVAQMEKCAEMVDELHIVVSENPEKTAKLCESSGLDPIPGRLRVEWLEKHFENNPKVKVFYFDETGLKAFPEGLKEWSEKFKSQFKGINVKFADETYRELNEKWFPECEFVVFDRTVIPVSSTMIRNDIKKNIKYVIEEAREYFEKYL